MSRITPAALSRHVRILLATAGLLILPLLAISQSSPSADQAKGRDNKSGPTVPASQGEPWLQLIARSPDLPITTLGATGMSDVFQVSRSGSAEIHRSTGDGSSAFETRRPWPWPSLRFSTQLGTNSSGSNHVARLEEGWLPVLQIEQTADSVLYSLRTLATRLTVQSTPTAGDNDPDPLVLVSEIRLTNTVAQPRRAEVNLRWDPSGGPFQISVDGTVVLLRPSDGMPRDGLLAVRAFIRTAGKGELDTAVVEGSPGAFRPCVRYAIELPANGSHAIEIVIPGVELMTATELQKAKSLRFQAAYKSVSEAWRRQLGEGFQLDFPSNPFARFLQSFRREALMAKVVRPTSSYKQGTSNVWNFEETPTLIRALEMLGHHDAARAHIEASLGLQTDQNVETNQSGVELPAEQEALLIATAAEHTRWTRDGTWIAKIAKRLVSECESLYVLTLPVDGPKAEGAPSGAISLRLISAVHSALAQSSDALTLGGHPDAPGIARNKELLAVRLRTAFRAAMEKAPTVIMKDGSKSSDPRAAFLIDAAQATTNLNRGVRFDPVSGLFGDGLFPSTNPIRSWAAKTWFEANTQGRSLDTIPILMPSSELFREGPMAASKILDATAIKILNAPEDQTSLQQRAALAQWIRTLFVSEHEEELWLLPGIQSDWMKPDGLLQIRGAPTYFGLLNLSARLDAAGTRLDLRCNLEETRNQRPSGVVLQKLTGAGRKLRKIQCNGKTVHLPTGNEPIRLPGGTNEWTVTLDLN